MNGPEIVWADEPTGNLDNKNAREVMDLHIRLNKELEETFVIVTHSDAMAEMSHRTVRMQDGLIVDDGTGNAIKSPMDELFGAPITNIAAVLTVAFGLAVVFLLYIRVRHPILVRMAVRNVVRRPGQSLLIISGLMLATAIISSAFTVGDSVTYSIKNSAAASLRSVDEILVVDEDSNFWEGRALPDGF